MKTTGICIWFLLNMMFMGMMGYMYLLWVQYRRYQQNSSKINAAQDLYHPDGMDPQIDFHMDHIHIRKGRPRMRPRSLDVTHESGFLFPVYDSLAEKEAAEVPTTTQKTTTTPRTTMDPVKLSHIIEKHKMLITVQFRTSQMEAGNILFKHENRYGVRFRKKKIKTTPSKHEYFCKLKEAMVRGLRDGDEPFTVEGMAKYFPSEDILEGKYYNTCAVVTSAGSLKDSSLGKFIDSHDAVVRFNHAPTKGFEKDVGSKTTLRIVNSQVVTKPEFDFWGSPLYRNVTMLIWDPSNYTASLGEWYSSPDFPVFGEYFRRRLMIPHETMHFLHPASLWTLWDVLQTFTHNHILPNPPSSGFVGMVLMLHHCQKVNVFEYIPSIRFKKQCHYWDPGTDIGCTFGDWHPLATEKLVTMIMNYAKDIDTYVKGYATLPGFQKVSCSTSQTPSR